ncbi:MAG TPA: glycosyltransferase [Gemmatimonadales bacterium]|nr:glycosyltransferase [Gemmatimonadales bacterium]
MISLIVPAFNEARYLPRLLDSVERARAAYRGAPADVEIVVADDASTDGTAVLAAARGCRVVTTPLRSIAATRNAGAAAAHGEVLAFVDADSRIHPETFNAIASALADGRVIGGATGVTMERWSAGLAATYAVLVVLVWLTGFDTGVVFVRRTDFEAVGGYDRRRRFAEDVAFLHALWRRGRKTDRRLVRLRGARAIASSRKFDEHGDWHYFGFFRQAIAQWLGMGDLDATAERYWYHPSR